MGTNTDSTLVVAARAGDAEALETLMAQFLPLAYNIVGHALRRAADVDDVVQEAMLRVVRGLPGLRDPERFRSWLVAVVINQVRDHVRVQGTRPTPVEDITEFADPGGDFVDETVLRLHLSGQRREVAEATRWLDEGDRELLALWWLVEAGELTRGELVAAVGLDRHHVTVRIARMRDQLAVARQIVRVLARRSRCWGIREVGERWDGVPTPLWRKRFARHIRDCEDCGVTPSGLIPAERLLAGLALVPVPAGSGLHMAALQTAHVGVRGAGNVADVAVRHSATVGRAGHAAPKAGHLGLHTLTGKVTAAALTAVAATGTAVMVSLPDGGHRPPVAAVESGVGTVARPSAPSSAAATTAATTPSPPATTKSTTVSPTAEEQVLAVINHARASHGLPPMTRTPALDASAAAHNRAMAAGCGLSHQCPGEAALGARETAAGVRWGTAGENIGSGGPVSSAGGAVSMAVGLTDAMLAETAPDDGHRQNILSPSFRHIGILVTRDPQGDVWMTQDFSD
ncbi:sigma-70 family RNA polymerase sigma factor [Catenulispora subtropica]|uniref:RNA polymerase, sigma-24 subunit, ECF subfamily n=1 Tax=Catenulispora subtropica TaxID=450798 RepID=A0ABP5CBS7_9ACTN